MLARRIIPCLDVRDGRVVKGTQFRDHEDVGDIIELASRYRDEGADELVFYDITASSDGRTVSTEWVTRVARVLDIPFCVAGGIRSLDGARAILHGGADKISINSPALENPALIGELAREFGSQCVVVGIDSRTEDGDYFVKQYTGDPAKTRATRWRTLDWAVEAQKLGAGEIVLNCMNQDGVRRGYDLVQLKALRALLHIPLVASGGAGEISHFNDVFRLAGVDGALAASVFHKGIISIPRLKEQLLADGIPIRP
jgi:imidazole glycerol-phosphate synthase subunit HisF